VQPAQNFDQFGSPIVPVSCTRSNCKAWARLTFVGHFSDPLFGSQSQVSLKQMNPHILVFLFWSDMRGDQKVLGLT